MIPASFDESNHVLDKPTDMTRDDCEPLSVFYANTKVNDNVYPVIVSCWKLTKDELEEITKTGRVWLIVYGNTMPPVMLEGIKPEMK